MFQLYTLGYNLVANTHTYVTGGVRSEDEKIITFLVHHTCGFGMTLTLVWRVN